MKKKKLVKPSKKETKNIKNNWVYAYKEHAGNVCGTTCGFNW